MSLWISVQERFPTKEEVETKYIVAWSVKYGRTTDDYYKTSGFPLILDYNHTTNSWEDDLGRDYECNPDHHVITHWKFIDTPYIV